ncbi:polysaccharide biosynthesis C-terminal domain-containing protein [Tenacibaculum maritimum]|uniref:polysaccharide biosynthesis C-terminal domain-containing protein n=1 Tax=Tenacibaculum maritimum TaxID=107401 RepID=UPI0012E61EEF|nr:polysaccharide biosynthesis C-terminal domain-containing protein [Tenacibaculum maritimum]CAA0188364.1 Probable transmembrane hypothetical protein. Putative polysaccharide biosynthesis protein [Tenacibaculum maritimum]
MIYKELHSYLKGFFSRSGSYVFIATIMAKGLSFLTSLAALYLIPSKTLGAVLFAYNIITFLIPISGLGLHQGLLRYGAILKDQDTKDSLFLYVFKNGFWASLLLTFILVFISILIPFQFKETSKYLALLAFLLIPSYILGIIKIQFRLKNDNKSFAFSEIVYHSILIISVVLLSYFYKEMGYITALLISPAITSFIFIKKLRINFQAKKKLAITNYRFWKYGFFTSLSNVIGQLLFVIDILLIGILLNDPKMVTNYRYVSLIPFSLLFLPRVFINTDFVAFTEKIDDKKYIINYIKSYTILFLIISIIFTLISFIFSNQILSTLDESFTQYSTAFFILTIGISGIYTSRGLYGNLLSSIGKATVNYYIALSGLALNIISNYFLIPLYGITGAAMTTAFLMWATGLASLILFWFFYKKRIKKITI